ncbi:MAG: anion permease [Chlamydiia bacterium]|nr:anion permease [Chlamydiia bacterium]
MTALTFSRKNASLFVLCFLVSAIIWFLPEPQGVSTQAWHLFAIFIFTVLGVVTKPMPIGTIAFIGLMLVTLTKTLTFDEAFTGFSNNIVWLIVFAFFIARGFIQTGLGFRIAYHLMNLMGKSTLGMGYGLIATDFLLSSAIPSLTARTGGVLFPLLNSLCKAFGSEPHSHPRKVGAFLFVTVFQGSVITSGIFLTAMAGNPMIADLAEQIGITIGWGKWAAAAIVPGIISLIVVPYFIYKVYPPEQKETPDAKKYATKKLKEMGKISIAEWIMLLVFVLLIVLWAAAKVVGIHPAVTAMVGLSLLLLSKVISWDDITSEKGAWNILVWFSVLLMMAAFLTKLGFMSWFSELVMSHLQGMNWMLGFSILFLVYFYSHYFFASNAAHIGAMFLPFLVLATAMGTPPVLAVFSLAFASSLFGGITHYGCGPAPIFFGAGYVKIADWWKLGFYISVINIIIWIGIGSLWWKLIGLY